jgi:hypothetical protein
MSFIHREIPAALTDGKSGKLGVLDKIAAGLFAAIQSESAPFHKGLQRS